MVPIAKFLPPGEVRIPVQPTPVKAQVCPDNAKGLRLDLFLSQKTSRGRGSGAGGQGMGSCAGLGWWGRGEGLQHKPNLECAICSLRKCKIV